MSKSPLNTLLLAILTVSTLASVGLCFMYISNARQFRSLNNQVAFINQRNQAIQALANDAIEYSKRNPAIDPILQSIGAKPKAGQPATK
jgi:hypothetical protein